MLPSRCEGDTSYRSATVASTERGAHACLASQQPRHRERRGAGYIRKRAGAPRVGWVGHQRLGEALQPRVAAGRDRDRPRRGAADFEQGQLHDVPNGSRLVPRHRLLTGRQYQLAQQRHTATPGALPLVRHPRAGTEFASVPHGG